MLITLAPLKCHPVTICKSDPRCLSAIFLYPQELVLALTYRWGPGCLGRKELDPSLNLDRLKSEAAI